MSSKYTQDPECSSPKIVYKKSPKGVSGVVEIQTLEVGFLQKITMSLDLWGGKTQYSTEAIKVLNVLPLGFLCCRKTLFVNCDLESRFQKEIVLLEGRLEFFPTLCGVFYLEIGEKFIQFSPKSLIPDESSKETDDREELHD